MNAWSDDSHLVDILLEHGWDEDEDGVRHRSSHFRPPFYYFYCCCENKDERAQAAAVLQECRMCIMQFVLLKPVLVLLPYFLRICQLNLDKRPPYHDGHVDFGSTSLYITLCGNVSVGLAFYGLVSFYHAIVDELAWCEPWPKFLCIKGVVFMTFWQVGEQYIQ